MTAVSEPTTDSSDSTTSSQHDALACHGYVILVDMLDPEQLALVRIQPSTLRTLGAPTGELLPVRRARSRERNVTSPELSGHRRRGDCTGRITRARPVGTLDPQRQP
jgi:hypothetical protein